MSVEQQVKSEAVESHRERGEGYWEEFVSDLWERRLPHLREAYGVEEVVLDLWEKGLSHLHEEVYGEEFVYDPKTGKYGFQVLV